MTASEKRLTTSHAFISGESRRMGVWPTGGRSGGSSAAACACKCRWRWFSFSRFDLEADRAPGQSVANVVRSLDLSAASSPDAGFGGESSGSAKGAMRFIRQTKRVGIR